jgi:hypothetical protein
MHVYMQYTKAHVYSHINHRFVRKISVEPNKRSGAAKNGRLRLMTKKKYATQSLRTLALAVSDFSRLCMLCICLHAHAHTSRHPGRKRLFVSVNVWYIHVCMHMRIHSDINIGLNCKRHKQHVDSRAQMYTQCIQT